MSAATTSTDYTTATTADAAIPALTAMSTTTSRPHTPPPPPLRKAPPLSRPPPLGHQRERMRGSVRLWNRRGTVVERQQWMRAKAAKRVSEMGTDGKSADAGSGRPGRWNADSGGRMARVERLWPSSGRGGRRRAGGERVRRVLDAATASPHTLLPL